MVPYSLKHAIVCLPDPAKLLIKFDHVPAHPGGLWPVRDQCSGPGRLAPVLSIYVEVSNGSGSYILQRINGRGIPASRRYRGKYRRPGPLSARGSIPGIFLSDHQHPDGRNIVQVGEACSGRAIYRRFLYL